MKILTIAVKLFSLTLVFILLTGFQKLSAQLFFANLEGSQIKISSSKNNLAFAPITSQFTCEGNFTMVKGELAYLNALKFNLPNTAQPKNDIQFELTHSMVLPELNVIHAIGYLAIQGVRTRVDFHLEYLENNSETITVMGKRSIKLSDYKKGYISVFADEKAQDIIQLDLKLVLKNPSNLIASSRALAKDLSRD